MGKSTASSVMLCLKMRKPSFSLTVAFQPDTYIFGLSCFNQQKHVSVQEAAVGIYLKRSGKRPQVTYCLCNGSILIRGDYSFLNAKL